MTEEEFLELVKLPESEILDYKRQGYDFALKDKKIDFIKDVLAMANTPRQGCARIVLGVSWTPEHGSELVGLEKQLDDVDFQGAIGIGWTQPKPRFFYRPIKVAEKHFGVVEIEWSKDGPFTPLKDGEGLQAGAIYWRRGTQNERAVGTELREILGWFVGKDFANLSADHELAWLSVLDSLHKFESSTNYVLVTDRVPDGTSATVTALANIPWKAVFDFDPKSDSDGLLSIISAAIQSKRLIHKVVRGDPFPAVAETGVSWYFARGLVGRQETLVDGDYKAWVRLYKKEIGRYIQSFAANLLPEPVVVVIVLSDANLKKHIRVILEEMLGAFGESIEIVAVVPTAELVNAISDGDEEDGLAKVFKLDLRSLCNGIAVHYADQFESGDDRCVMPSISGAPVEISRDNALWLSEHLELASRDIGQNGDDEPTQYRRGADITWRNLNLRHDCERDICAQLTRQVEDDLKRRQAIRINLYHVPGAGGTTLSMRIAWDMHNLYPEI